MCGICGIFNRVSSRDLESDIDLMKRTLRHRGPDDEGVWVSEDCLIGLGHQRLSVIDCSPAGHQPMTSRCQRYTVVYNGEIYNHEDIKKDLDRQITINWRGHSDTEILLEAISFFGFAEAIKKTNGMFAIAVWDKKTRQLFLARDRVGEKPLYYGWHNGRFVFASELKALQAIKSFNLELDKEALTMFLRFGYVPTPHSVYKGVYKLEPGSYLKVSQNQEEKPKPQKYWSLIEVVSDGLSNPFSGSENDAIDELEALLKNSIKGRMLSDVPLGAFLSGGFDSSTVVAMMQEQSNRPVKTYSIGTEKPGFNEAPYAKSIARHLGTDHTELVLKSENSLEVIPQLATMYDEPFADSSQIPTYLVSKLAREEVTVALSGDGGDELFGGYNRHFWAPHLWNRMRWFPPSARSVVSKIGVSIPPTAWDFLFTRCSCLLPKELKSGLGGEKTHKFLHNLGSTSPRNFYQKLASVCDCPESLIVDPTTQGLDNIERLGTLDKLSFQEYMMFVDMATYLPDDILTKVDRASMAVSLESRIPLLDHKIVEFAWRIPAEMKTRNREGKWILRQLLYRKVPKELMDRPKLGFGIPIASWLREPLKDWAESLLSKERLESSGLLNSKPIREMWEEHLARKRNHQHRLWNVLMLQSWLEQNHG